MLKRPLPEESSMYVFLDTFFFVFHSAVIAFNLFGWLWGKTRLVNLILLVSTGFSWFVLGIWYGFGFCPCTEWHWQVRMKLGDYDMPRSYTKFLIDSMTGLDVDAALMDTLTLVLFASALFASVMTNAKAWRQGGRR